MSIVLFEQDALGYSTRVFFVRSVGVDLITSVDVKSYVTASIDDILDVFFKLCLNKIAAELFWQKSWEFEL